MKHLSKQLRGILLLCLLLAGTTFAHGQATPTIKIDGDVNPGSKISVTGSPAGAVLSIYIPPTTGAICGAAGLFDLGSPVLISDSGGAPAQTIKISGQVQPINLSTAVKARDTLCLYVALGNDEAFFSQKVVNPPGVNVQFAAKPLVGSNTISVQGDNNAVIAVVQFANTYTPEPKSERCSAADYGKGQVIPIGAKDPKPSISLNGTAPFTITLNKPLQAGTQLCLYAMETVAGAGTAKGYSPFTAVAATPPAEAQEALSISPVPTSSDLEITLDTGTVSALDTITILAAETANTCATGKEVLLEEHTGNLVLAGGTTKVRIQPDQLTAGAYLCAVTKSSAGTVTGTAAAVAIGKQGAPISSVPTIATIPTADVWNVTLNTAPAAVGDTIAIYAADAAGKCPGTDTPKPLALVANTTDKVLEGAQTTVQLQQPLASGTTICAVITGKSGDTNTTAAVVVNPVCRTPGRYSDCTFEYLLIGGIEQSDLSAQNSVTEGFYDLFLRRPVDSNWGSIWFRSRFLGTPSSSSTQNIVAAATNPTGTLTASNLPQSVTAVDYVLGLQFDHWVNPKNRFSYSPIVGFGATTPLSASTTVAGYMVPAYGTNECNQLQARFGTAQGYNPPLPSSGLYGTSPGTMGCVVQPNPLSTTSNPLPGTQITDIAFSNEDRSSFLLKWGGGVRIIDRPLASGSTGCGSGAGCSRLMADFTVGQDQAITGGYWRHFVLKADAIIPLFSTGVYFFASSANRIEHNTTLSPLILSPVTIATNTSSSTCTASSTTVCFPSPSVFVLPYKQQNRDYYRIGIGIDLIKVFTKLFPTTTTSPANAATSTPATADTPAKTP